MTEPKVAAILCARMSSDRLPGKMLRSYSPDGKPNLGCIIDRILSSRHNVSVVVATSISPSDDEIADYAREKYCHLDSHSFGRKSVRVFRGSLSNVVQRFDGALRQFVPDATHVWRIMGDCPLLDVGLNDWRTDVLHRTQADATMIVGPEPTYAAMGSVWSRQAWDWCAKNSSGSLLEHPGEAIWQSSGQFRIVRDPGPESIYYLPVRTELDTEEDLEFFRRVWAEYPPSIPQERVDIQSRTIYHWPGDKSYDTKGVLTWLSSKPNLMAINSHVQEKTHYNPQHGHKRARNVICQNCRETIGYRFNDKLVLRCSSCGEVRDYY